jgi:hypothetical protein
MTKDQLLHAIDCAYDCDEPKLIHRLEAEMRNRFPVTLEPPHLEPVCDPLADTAKLFGVE